MSWARLDDACTDHLKLRRAGTAGLALWTASIVWCSRHLTDGFIPTDMLHDIWRPVGESFDADAACARLVAAGLWDEVEGGWKVHDYLDYNMSRAEVMSRREQAADRQRRRRTKAHPEYVTHDVTRDIPRDSRGTYSVSHATPTRPDPTPTDTPRAPARVASAVPLSSIECPDPLGEYETISSAELPWRTWVAASRKRGMRVTDSDRRCELRNIEDIERRVLELVPEIVEARSMEPGDAARSLVALAYREYGRLYDETNAEGYRGKPLPWRLAFVVARWAELTKDAIPARAT